MSTSDPENSAAENARQDSPESDDTAGEVADRPAERPREIGGRGGLDPTRYGDWEKAGRCIDF
jgi:hypothetical protein